jgi:hypothetical protein
MEYREAIDCATWRGHQLGGFVTAVVAAGSGEQGWEALCVKCGMDASVWARGYPVRGEAVALNCTGE